MNFFNIVIVIVLLLIAFRIYKGGVMRRDIKTFFLPILFLGLALSFIIFKYRIDTRMMVSLVLIDLIIGVVGGYILAFITSLKIVGNGEIYREGGILPAAMFIAFLAFKIALSRRLIERIGGEEIAIVSLFLALSIQFLIRNILVSKKIKKMRALQRE